MERTHPGLGGLAQAMGKPPGSHPRIPFDVSLRISQGGMVKRETAVTYADLGIARETFTENSPPLAERERANGIRRCLVGTTGYKWETRGGAPEKSTLASFFQGSCFAMLASSFSFFFLWATGKHGRALRECLP